MSAAHSRDVLDRLVVRVFRRGDQAAVSRLYTEGLIRGQVAPNDTGADIENIQEAYLSDPAINFWVAELDGTVLGMIGVARDYAHTAEIRRLRVEKDWQNRGIGPRLIQTALDHCRRHGYLKVVLDTRFDPQRAQDLFTECGFQHTRTKSVGDKELLEFYLDLYRPTREHEGGAGI